MIDFNLLTDFVVPAGVPATPAEVLHDNHAIDRRQTQHSQFEKDAFDYSGKRSQTLFSVSMASTPLATTGLPSDVKEDDSARTHEAASEMISTAGSAVRQAATTLLPAAAALGAGLSVRGGGSQGKK